MVASLEYRLHPVGPSITGGLVAYPFDRSKEVLQFYRDVTASLPDELTVFAALVHAPDGTKLTALVLCHCGPLGEGEAATWPIKQFGSPVMDTIGPMPYCELNTMLDAAFPKGALNYWKSSFLARLSDDAIDSMIACFSVCPTPMGQVLIEHFHGAATRVSSSDTAFPHRAEGYNLLLVSEWMDHATTDRCIAWARDTYSAMGPFVASRRYVNYLGDDEEEDSVAAAYGRNYQRLRELKAKYDPENFFHINQNICPLS